MCARQPPPSQKKEYIYIKIAFSPLSLLFSDTGSMVIQLFVMDYHEPAVSLYSSSEDTLAFDDTVYQKVCYNAKVSWKLTLWAWTIL